MSAKSGVAGLLKGLVAMKKYNAEQVNLKPIANAALAKLLAYKKSKRPRHVRALSAARRLAGTARRRLGVGLGATRNFLGRRAGNAARLFGTAKRRMGVGLTRLHKATLGSAGSRTRFGKGVNAVKGFFGARAGNAGVLLGRAREGLGGLGRGIASGFGALKGLFTRRATSAKKQQSAKKGESSGERRNRQAREIAARLQEVEAGKNNPFER